MKMSKAKLITIAVLMMCALAGTRSPLMAQAATDSLPKASTTQLATVGVSERATGPSALKLAEFEERRKEGVGRFITGDIFTREDGRPVSSIITQRMSGVRIIQADGRKYLATNRGAEARLQGHGARFSADSPTRNVQNACYSQIIVDGAVRYNGSHNQPLFDVDQLDAKDILGFEFHSTASTPSQYNNTQSASGGPCGTVMFWTKGS